MKNKNIKRHLQDKWALTSSVCNDGTIVFDHFKWLNLTEITKCVQHLYVTFTVNRCARPPPVLSFYPFSHSSHKVAHTLLHLLCLWSLFLFVVPKRPAMTSLFKVRLKWCTFNLQYAKSFCFIFKWEKFCPNTINSFHPTVSANVGHRYEELVNKRSYKVVSYEHFLGVGPSFNHWNALDRVIGQPLTH